MKSFKAVGSIGDGLNPILHKSAPQVALFSSRGPNIRDYSFEDADILKPDILAPGSLIWAAWAPNGTDEANYVGKYFTVTSPKYLRSWIIAYIKMERHLKVDSMYILDS